MSPLAGSLSRKQLGPDSAFERAASFIGTIPCLGRTVLGCDGERQRTFGVTAERHCFPLPLPCLSLQLGDTILGLLPPARSADG